MATIKASELNTWTTDEYERIESASSITGTVESAISSFEITAKDIADEAFKKAWRLIKKTRWQGHFNTRKRSRRF